MTVSAIVVNASYSNALTATTTCTHYYGRDRNADSKETAPAARVSHLLANRPDTVDTEMEILRLLWT